MSTETRSVDAMTEVGHAFKRTLAAMRRLRGREIRCADELSDAQYGLLFALLSDPSLSARDLAELADVSPASATEMLDALAAAGLVHRERSETDRRVVLSSLTERGHELVEERRARYEPRWRAALAEFSDEELVRTAAVLDRIRAMFEELSEERAVRRD